MKKITFIITTMLIFSMIFCLLTACGNDKKNIAETAIPEETIEITEGPAESVEPETTEVPVEEPTEEA